MSIVAFASANQNPVANPNQDPQVDLQDPLIVLPQNVMVHAGCVDDSGNPGPFTYQWYLMAKPPGSAAALDDETITSPTLEDVDIWGNYRLFVVATNTATGETSQADPLRAPSSAFCVVRVISPKQGIQKMAAGERNWFNEAWTWAQRIEDFQAGLAPHKIIDHIDVVDATGFDLENLTGGGYAVDPEPAATGQPANAPDAFGNSILHKHYGSDVDVATVATPGTIFLEPGFQGNPQQPTALANDFVKLSAHAFHTLDSKVGLVGRIMKGRFVGGHGQAPLFMWCIPPGLNGQWEIRNYGVHFNACTPTPKLYKFELVKGSHNGPLNVFPIANSQFHMPPLFQPAQVGAQHWADWAHEVNNGSTAEIDVVVGGTDWLGFRILESPDLADASIGITVTVFLRRVTS